MEIHVSICVLDSAGASRHGAQAGWCHGLASSICFSLAKTLHHSAAPSSAGRTAQSRGDKPLPAHLILISLQQLAADIKHRYADAPAALVDRPITVSKSSREALRIPTQKDYQAPKQEDASAGHAHSQVPGRVTA